VPFNIASYATLLHLLSLESGFKAGKLTGNFGDIHIYENHMDALDEQNSRSMFAAPKINTEDFTSIFNWEAGQTKLVDYNSHSAIKGTVAV
jgi:thymidylate synthase